MRQYMQDATYPQSVPSAGQELQFTIAATIAGNSAFAYVFFFPKVYTFQNHFIRKKRKKNIPIRPVLTKTDIKELCADKALWPRPKLPKLLSPTIKPLPRIGLCSQDLKQASHILLLPVPLSIDSILLPGNRR